MATTRVWTAGSVVLRRLLRDIGDDQETTQAWVLWSELAGAAVFDESLREPINDGYRAWVEQIASLIRVGSRTARFPDRWTPTAPPRR